MEPRCQYRVSYCCSGLAPGVSAGPPYGDGAFAMVVVLIPQEIEAYNYIYIYIIVPQEWKGCPEPAPPAATKPPLVVTGSATRLSCTAKGYATIVDCGGDNRRRRGDDVIQRKREG